MFFPLRLTIKISLGRGDGIALRSTNRFRSQDKNSEKAEDDLLAILKGFENKELGGLL